MNLLYPRVQPTPDRWVELQTHVRLHTVVTSAADDRMDLIRRAPSGVAVRFRMQRVVIGAEPFVGLVTGGRSEASVQLRDVLERNADLPPGFTFVLVRDRVWLRALLPLARVDRRALDAGLDLMVEAASRTLGGGADAAAPFHDYAD